MIENEMTVSVPLEVVKASENRAERSEMAMVSIYSGWQGYAVAGRSRRWKSKLMLSIAALLSKGEPLPLPNGRKRAYDYHLSDNGR